jgi:hypothetical protein
MTSSKHHECGGLCLEVNFLKIIYKLELHSKSYYNVENLNSSINIMDFKFH